MAKMFKLALVFILAEITVFGEGRFVIRETNAKLSLNKAPLSAAVVISNLF